MKSAKAMEVMLRGRLAVSFYLSGINLRLPPWTMWKLPALHVPNTTWRSSSVMARMPALV